MADGVGWSGTGNRVGCEGDEVGWGKGETGRGGAGRVCTGWAFVGDGKGVGFVREVLGWVECWVGWVGEGVSVGWRDGLV